MKEVTATIDDDTAGELGALAAAVGMPVEVLAAAFILEGVQRHKGPHNSFEPMLPTHDRGGTAGALWGQG